MSWRVAKSLLQLKAEVDRLAPNRSKAADGTIGDQKHRARKSDHNPNAHGVVLAMDITHDPLNGVDSYKIADALKASGDSRLSYVISNGRIWNPKISSGWRKYTGSNKHTQHVHISVLDDPKLYDSQRDWTAIPDGVGPSHVDPSAKPVPPLIKLGSPESIHVETIWSLLRRDEEGFGPILEAAVKAYQRKHGLDDDGMVGPYTWGRLLKEK